MPLDDLELFVCDSFVISLLSLEVLDIVVDVENAVNGYSFLDGSDCFSWTHLALFLYEFTSFFLLDHKHFVEGLVTEYWIDLRFLNHVLGIFFAWVDNLGGVFDQGLI